MTVTAKRIEDPNERFAQAEPHAPVDATEIKDSLSDMLANVSLDFHARL